MTQRHVEKLSQDSCTELLKESPIGRIIFTDDDGPNALPINYGLFGNNIVFRIEQRSRLRKLLKGRVAFEVDHMETDASSGWSVIVRGTAHEVPIDQVHNLVQQMKETLPRPWAEGVHNIWVEIEPEEVTGRRLTSISTTSL
jgi:nitroimidazol reductase NimA-like FMN-containing flavoprotein (pyridoxamine 5'-phosphate oxidase superfamily)